MPGIAYVQLKSTNAGRAKIVKINEDKPLRRTKPISEPNKVTIRKND